MLEVLVEVLEDELMDILEVEETVVQANKS